MTVSRIVTCYITRKQLLGRGSEGGGAGTLDGGVESIATVTVTMDHCRRIKGLDEKSRCCEEEEEEEEEQSGAISSLMGVSSPCIRQLPGL